MIHGGPAPEPLQCALLVVLALCVAGAAHVAWLRSGCSRRFAIPLDLGLRLRGKPLFGANKTLRGLMMMPIASAASFWLLALAREALPPWLQRGLWDAAPAQMASVGFICGLAFMLAELPNSLFKRQLDVSPGAAPDRPMLRALCFVIDRCDSAIGALAALGLMLPLRAETWVWALLFGTTLHWAFSFWLYRLKLKARPS